MRKTIALLFATYALLLVGFPDSLLADDQSTNDLFAPVFVNRPDHLYFNHCDTARYTFQAVSAATGLPSIWIHYRLVSGPGSIDAVTGEWKYPPTWNRDSIGTYELVVRASERGISTEGLQDCRVPIEIENNLFPPYPVAPFDGTWELRIGIQSQLTLRYNQYLWCDTVRTFLAGISPQFDGEISYSSNGGFATLVCRPDTADAGKSFEVSIGATNAVDTIYTTIRVEVLSWETFSVKISSLDQQVQGTFATVPVRLETRPLGLSLGGFDFLIAYDNSVLSLQEVSKDSSGPYRECGWEYFTYRFGANGNCGEKCPSGMVRVVGIAETNNGDYHPTCGPDFVPETPTELFRMRFLVSNNRTYECQWVPIRFFWIDCGDNTMAVVGGSRVFLESTLWEADSAGGTFFRINPEIVAFPGYSGIPSGVCGDSVYPDSLRQQFQRLIDFYNGGIEIICSGFIDARGDINLNGINYEVADQVMLQNYFLYGTSAFGTHVAGSIAASDVNNDGIPTDLSDLVYLWRVIYGDALPNPPRSSSEPVDTVTVYYGGGAIALQSDVNLGALRLVFDGNVIAKNLRYPNWQLYYVPGDTSIAIVVGRDESINDSGFASGHILDIQTSGPATLISASAATRDGKRVAVVIETPTDVDEPNGNVPGKFALYQNYPNPFNAGTVIKFDLARSGSVSLEIVNILGQVVWSKRSTYGAGSHQVLWDGRNDAGVSVSSGVYYYRLTAGKNVVTKKMVLLK